MRVPEHCADSLTGRTEDWGGQGFPLCPAGWATLARLGLRPRARGTGGAGGEGGGALHPAPRQAGAGPAGLPGRPPGLARAEGSALLVALLDLPGGGQAGGEAGGGEGGGAGAGGAGVRVELGPGTVQLVPPETPPGLGLDLSPPGAGGTAGPGLRHLQAQRAGEDGAGLDGAGQDSALAPTLPAGRGRVCPHLALGQEEAGQSTLGVQADGAALAGDDDGVVAGEDGVAGLSVLGQHAVVALSDLTGLTTAPPSLPRPQARPVQSAGTALSTALPRAPGDSEAAGHSRAVSPPVLALGPPPHTGAGDAGVEVGDAGHLHGLSVSLVTLVVFPGQLGQGRTAEEQEEQSEGQHGSSPSPAHAVSLLSSQFSLGSLWAHGHSPTEVTGDGEPLPAAVSDPWRHWKTPTLSLSLSLSVTETDCCNHWLDLS